MLKSERILWLMLSLLLVALQPFAAAAMEYHALLIGVGGTQFPLPGVKHDVRALRETLTGKYGFNPENIVTLEEEQATKEAILAEIDSLEKRSKAGDRIFLYYSGHGTSSSDANFGGGLDLPHTSGALVPYDAKLSEGYTADQILDSIIVGKRDLRPRILRLEKDRLVLAVFDSCFSENAMRNQQGGISRFIPMNVDSDMDSGFQASTGKFGKTKKEEPYPYTTVFFISAASESEKAWDAPGATSYETYDNKPHGLLTDQILRILNGKTKADNNNDNQLSFGELFQSVKGTTVFNSEKFFQSCTPHALPENGTLQTEHFFRSVSTPDPAAAVAVEETNLANKEYPNQSFNVTVDLMGKHGDTLWLGDNIGYSMYTEKDAYLLLLNVNPEGAIYVIYPFEERELAKVAGRKTVFLNLGEVAPPVGREVLKLVAFLDKPAGFDQLLGAEDIRPGSTLYKQLETILGLRGADKEKISRSAGIAQQTIVTTSKERIPDNLFNNQ